MSLTDHGDLDRETLAWAVDAARLVRNPVFPGAVFSALLVAAGVAVLAISGWAASGQYYVSLQVPFLISGGLGGLGLVVAGCGLGSVLGHRRDEALADEEYGRVLTELAEVARDELYRRSAR